MDKKKPKISLVIPVFNEKKTLIFFLDATQKAIQSLDGYTFEFLFVDDGSTDSTWDIINDLSKKDGRVKGIRFSKNFGKEVALTAGLESASDSDAIIFIDADLQHPPEVIKEFVKQWENGFNIIRSQRKTIEYSMIRKLGSTLFYLVLKRFSDINILPKTSDFQLIDKQVIKELLAFKERNRFFRGLIDWVGFNKKTVFFDAPSRIGGKSSYTFRKLFVLAINSFTSFSLLPLRVAGYLGLAITLSTSIVLLYMISSHLILKLQFYTPLAYFVVFNTFLFGIVLAALGLIALYIGRIHSEVIGRPLYIIQDKVGFPD